MQINMNTVEFCEVISVKYESKERVKQMITSANSPKIILRLTPVFLTELGNTKHKLIKFVTVTPIIRGRSEVTP